jgi:membrane-associated phospholipid phosphatase
MVTIRFWRSTFERWVRQAFAAIVTVEVGLVGIARLVLDQHWPMDVIAGFLGGFVVLGLYAWWTRPGGWADDPPMRNPRATLARKPA